jgi:type VI secretion system secreted protein Hcp
MLKIKLAALTVAAGTALAIAPSAHAATDYFMRIDPGAKPDTQIMGESTDPAFPGKSGYIQIKSFSWSADNPSTIGSATTGAGGGKAKLQQLEVDKDVDSTTPQVFQRLAQGGHFAGVEIIARKAGGSPTAASNATRWYFSLAAPVSDEQSGDGGDETPQEKLTFAYGAVALRMGRQLPNGAVDKPALAQWDQITNTLSFDPDLSALPSEMTR